MKANTTASLLLTALLAATPYASEPYDPLTLPASGAPETTDLTVTDQSRQRDIPIRVYLPADQTPAPVILFSHGLGGSRNACTYLGKHWSARGYVAVFLQHPGSDDSVWRNEPRSKRMAAMNQAASGKNFILRVHDVPAVLDQLAKWNAESEHALNGRLDLKHVGMSGHSFGAVTTQSVSGQAARLVGQKFTDNRIRAAIAFSPSSPRRGDAATAFGSVTIPWMLMTGTKDTAPIGNADVASRLNVYPNLPNTIDKYEVLFHNAAHSAFSDRGSPRDKEVRNPNHHRAILALSTAFWDTHLRNDNAARQWLQGPGPPSILDEQDRWQTNTPR